ncbi:MAG: NAD(P)-dependent oxidoreductase [Dactylosporangium sp.]|nr:NAD(P)-dependent oxidoreductase [Dactylosporangium sp.]
MTRVLLFGSSGFMGGPVREALAADPRTTALTCPGRARHNLVTDDVPALVALIDEVAPDVVVNCAGRLAGTPTELMVGNAVVTARLVEAVATAAPGARVVRIGSAGEYGATVTGTAIGEEAATHPVSAYGISHVAATDLVRLASEAGQIDGVVLRVFNPIGPHCGEENLLGRAMGRIREAMGNGAGHITLGPLTAYRDFVDTRDVATAVVAAALAAKVDHRVLNVGSGRAVPASAAVESLARAAGFDGEIVQRGTGSARSGTVDYIRADITRIRTALGWTPEHDLDSTTRAMWNAAVRS